MTVDADSTYRICFVCMGNICRSPMAENVLRHELELAGLAHLVSVESAGTGGWHVGEPTDTRAAAVLREAGYLPDRHAARQFRAHWFRRLDLVVALDSENLASVRALAPDAEVARRVRLLRSFDPLAVAAGDLDVPDPYYGGPRGFHDVLAMVERACDGLIAELRARLVPDAR